MRIDGRFRVLRSLGGTPPTQVLEVWDEVYDCPRVLKGVSGDLSSPEVRRLLGELSLLGRLRHPRIVRLRGWGVAEIQQEMLPRPDELPGDSARSVGGPPGSAGPPSAPYYYGVLDDIAGTELRACLVESLPVRLSHFAALAEAVQAVHLHGVRLGDLKPANILLGPQGVLLIDFGLARESDALETPSIPIGTLAYMAPELLSGLSGDARADLFSLGVILFELLTGAPPFPEAETTSSRLSAWRSHLTSAPARSLLPEGLRQALPEPLQALLDRLLLLEPTRRMPDLMPVFQAMKLLLDGGMPLTLPEPVPFLPEAPLLGRATSLSALMHAWRGASRSGGGVRIEGEAGIGKSRLLEALAGQLQYEPGATWIQLGAEGLPERTRGLLLDWLSGGGGGPDAPPWLHHLDRLAGRAARGEAPPLALLLDDLDVAAGREGVWVCATREVGASPGAIGRASPGSSPVSSAPVGRPSEDTLPAPDWPVVRLEGLALEAAQVMVELASGLVRAPETIARFHQFSEGNPGVLRAILTHPDDMEAPSARLQLLLEPLVAGSVAELDPAEQALLVGAALLWEPILPELLAALLERPREEVGRGLERLVVRGLLVSEGVGGMRFRRPMVRAWAAGRLDASRRLALHRRAGLLLERRAQVGLPVTSPALAFHFDQTDDDERARRYLARALREAVASQQHLEAHALCQALARRLPPGDPERTRVFAQLGDLNLALQRFPQADHAYVQALAALEAEADPEGLLTALQADLLSRLARAREERGDFTGSREALEAALRRVQRDDDPADPGPVGSESAPREGGPDPLRLSLALARVCLRDAQIQRAQQLLALCRSALGPRSEPVLRGELELLEGQEALESGQLETAVQRLTQAIELAGRHHLEPLKMRALHNLHIAEARLGRLTRAVEHLEQALKLAEAAGDVARLGAGYNNLGNLQRRMGDLRAAQRSYRRALQTFERVGDRAGRATVHYSLAGLLRDRGELDRALESLEQAETLASAVGGGFLNQAQQRIRLVRGDVLLALGRVQEAQGLLERALSDAEARGDHESRGMAELALAELYLARGETLEVERRCAMLGAQDGSGRQAHAFHRTLSRLHFHLGDHYGRLYLDGCRDGGGLRLGTAQLELVRARLASDGPMGLRSHLSSAAQLLSQAGDGPGALQARSFLRELGADATERTGLLEAVLDILQHLNDRPQVLALLVVLAARVLRAERGMLLYRQASGELLEFSAFTAGQGPTLGDASKVARTIVARVAERWAPVVVADALEDPSLIGSESIHDLQIRSVLGLPIERDDGGAWILYLDHRQLPQVFPEQGAVLLERLRRFASGLLREIRWREVIRATLEADEPTSTRYGMVGRSRGIARVREYIDHLGQLQLANENLLFIGESGTGKELVARAVHQVVSAGRGMPFVAQSCADIPSELIESTLFGHRRGAFTGAREDRPGIFELASGGVLFLDEIGELPLTVQAPLLRVLEERTVSRVGEPEKPRALDLIVVCATNRDLEREVEAGRFRRDLFHRLNQVFRLPPLRERREDILPLIAHFMRALPDFAGLTPEQLFAPEVLLWCHEYDWPGNVRELRNLIDAIPVRVKARRGEQVRLEDLAVQRRELPPDPAPTQKASTEPLWREQESLRDFSERLESGFIRHVMETHDWDITRSAQRLGLTYQGLRKRLMRYDWMQQAERNRR